MDRFNLKLPADISFGEGVISKLPEKILQFGNDALIITGEYSLHNSGNETKLLDALKEQRYFLCYRKKSMMNRLSVPLML